MAAVFSFLQNSLLVAAVSAIAALVTVPAARAQSEPPIATALRAEPATVAMRLGNSRPVAAGSSFWRNDRVSTNASGRAELRFVDATDLTIGPSASVTLDAYVFSGKGSTASRFLLSLARGAMRFTTGRSAHDAYSVRTPFGTIGVRGTQFTIIVGRGGERVIVTQGRIRMCGAGGKCVTAAAGRTVQATPRELSVAATTGALPDLLKNTQLGSELPTQRLIPGVPLPAPGIGSNAGSLEPPSLGGTGGILAPSGGLTGTSTLPLGGGLGHLGR